MPPGTATTVLDPPREAAAPKPPEKRRPQPSRTHRRRPLHRHPVFRIVLAVVLVCCVWLGYSVGGALARPGNDSVSQRVAEWARDHNLNFLVTWLEQLRYNQDKPKVGGDVNAIPHAQGDEPSGSANASVPHSPAPAPLKPFVSDPKPGEGQWQDVVFNHGEAAIRITYLRPDDQHTSYLAAIMWMDPKLLAGRLHEGTEDPGGQWSTPPLITPELQKTVAAAFPGGFRLNNGPVGNRGGYYDEGRMAEPLRDGAASFVVFTDGTATVGQWGRDVRMGPNIRSVRQNLDLLVEDGQVNPTCADNNSPVWGYTLGNTAFVPRTALGVRADGSLVFVNSPATTVCSLGRLLQAAGAVRGMELDINPEWSIGYYFTHQDGQVKSEPTRPDQSQQSDHYFAPQSRDFIAFYLRP